MSYAIQVQQVKKTFKQQTAIEDISLTVKSGEIFGLLGPSGAGKTTMIKILIGESPKTAGTVQVLGYSPKHFNSATFKKQIGVLSDNSALYDRLTIQDNLQLFCKLYNIATTQIDTVLQVVNLNDEKHKQVAKLSKGMKQRALLAKALLHQPTLLFLDEPTSALDPVNREHIHKGLRHLNDQGTTIFLNTHDMDEATQLCDKVAFLNNGVIQEIGKPDDLRYQYSNQSFQITTIHNETLILENKPENAHKIAQLMQNEEIKRMETNYPTLGEIFLKVTGKELI